MFEYDDSVIDLNWVREAKDEPEKQRYLCRWCSNDGPDSVLTRQADPEQLKFVPAGVTRWLYQMWFSDR